MNIVDSSGWLEYFANTKIAGFFAKAIENTGELIVPTIIITEVFKKILVEKDENDALYAIAQMMQGKVAELSVNIAINAAKFGKELKLPLADSIIYATARFYDASIYTQDSDFKGLEKVFFIKKNN